MADFIQQIVRERLVLEVNDHGTRKEFVWTAEMKDFAPQELKLLTELGGYFKFLGFFKHLSLESLQEDAKGNVAIMQKK